MQYEQLLLWRLSSLNFVPQYIEEGEAFGGKFLVYAWIEGVTWKKWLESIPPLKEKKAIFLRLLYSMQLLHEKGIIHRDLKPDHLLLSPNRKELWIVDFGHSLQKSTPSPFSSFPLVGTPRYMSPEQRKAPEEVDERADIYTLGMLGRELFGSDFSSLFGKATCQRREERFSSVGELLSHFLCF